MRHFINNHNRFMVAIGTDLHHIKFQFDKDYLELYFEIQYGVGYSSLKFGLPF